MTPNGALLLGKRTYNDLYGFWPSQRDNPYTDLLNNITKYVASTTMSEPLAWSNSVLLPGDAADAVAKMRRSEGPDLVILGSTKLVHSLMRSDLIDEYLLIINPLLLGSGRKLFPDTDKTVPLELVSTTPTTTGVILAVYRRSTPDQKHRLVPVRSGRMATCTPRRRRARRGPPRGRAVVGPNRVQPRHSFWLASTPSFQPPARTERNETQP